MIIQGRQSINGIKRKLKSYSNNDLSIIEEIVNNSSNSLINLNTNDILENSIDRTFSVRLIKWVEPFILDNKNWSMFYTEVDHNLKKGDKIFIEGGFYDSYNKITQNRYGKGVDGYEVLYVDRTKLVLNIPYTGDLPTNEDPIDEFIKVYVADNQYEFDYFLQTLSMRKDGDFIQGRFLIESNNILFLNGSFTINPGDYDGLQEFLFEDTTTGLTNPQPMYVIRNTSNQLVEITSDVLSNNIIPYLNPLYTTPNSGFFNNGKLRIINNRFTLNGIEYLKDRVYKYVNGWVIDESYVPTLITKVHFRGGYFNSGKFNQGLYGRHESRLRWRGGSIEWRLGTALNVNWESGVLDSKHYYKPSYFTVFDRQGFPVIRSNSANNGGSGYNFVFNTDFSGGDVINGNIFNLSTFYGFGGTTQSVLSSYEMGDPIQTTVNLSGGVYYNSEILSADISNCTLISSYVINSMMTSVKAVNTEIVSSVFLNSQFIGDKVIKILGYEESNIVWHDVSNTPMNYKMYKFYVTDNSFLRLRELQNFYLKDISVLLPNQDLVNFFDDKFTIGHWKQTYDVVGLKPEREVLVQLSTKEENRNSPGVINASPPVYGVNELLPNDELLPSIDIFISGGDDFNFGSTSSIPRPFIAETIDIENAYILEGDFVSGLFKDSTWVSGNCIEYNLDHALEQTAGLYATSSLDSSNSELTLNIPLPRRPLLYGLNNEDYVDIVYLNGMYYDTGSELLRLPDTWLIDNITTNITDIDISLLEAKTDLLINWSSYTNQQNLTSIDSNIKWNYIHMVKFQNSTILSGFFRRTYFDNCTFNGNVDSGDKDISNPLGLRKLISSDILIDDNSNTINSGVFIYSSLLGGSDKWNSGVFIDGVWNGVGPVWATGPGLNPINRDTTSVNGGLVTRTKWLDGEFNAGLYYRNNSNIGGTTSVYSDTISAYYIDGLSTHWGWLSGTFNGGVFEKSNFESGLFTNGLLVDSNFFGGIASGGIFGKNNLPSDRTRIWSGTFSNMTVNNADFITENATGVYSTTTINWLSGEFNKGRFGTQMNMNSPIYDPQTFLLSSNWYGGNFNDGVFGDVAQWYNGNFNGGRFHSYFGYEGLVNPTLTPYEQGILGSASYTWIVGKFNGGEFGNGSTGSNATWYGGEFNGDVFWGRYWRDGILTGGEFIGSGKDSNTDISSHNDFINSFNYDYYGFWNSGYVSRNIDLWDTTNQIWTNDKKTKQSTLLNGVLWNSGTFSLPDALMINSVWLDGAHYDGTFKYSAFNPYMNKIETIQYSDWDKTNPTNVTEIQNGFRFSGLPESVLSYDVLQPGETYTIQFEILPNPISGFSTPNPEVNGVPYSITDSGIYRYTFVATNTRTLSLSWASSGGTLEMTNIELFTGTVSGFRMDSCIWKGGISEESDFYFSKWENGIFRSIADSEQGNAWGIKWVNGTAEYMNAHNIYWNSGTWRNGNWNGSPFIEIYNDNGQPFIYPGFSTDIINGIGLWASQSNNVNWEYIHMNNSFIYASGSVSEIEYHQPTNNQLVQPTWVVGIGSSIELSSTPLYQWATASLTYSTNFGNGHFHSGIWENGVWNDGWREDQTVIWSDSIVQQVGGKYASWGNNNIWTVKLKVLDNTVNAISYFNVGDRVLVGNLVTKDINDNRRLLRRPMIITYIENNIITLNINITFPIKGVFKDSDNHLMYITKSLWLNGVFLNGMFLNGVWGNGLFRGYPYITKAMDSHWIDGEFKGGRFKGLTVSYIDDHNNTNVINSSVIQRFSFFSDENVSNQPFQFQYNSWIDVNFLNEQGVNINRVNETYQTTPLTYETTFIENNYYGNPTPDVLESTCQIRNGFDLESRIYRLGWKYKEFTDIIPYMTNVDQFISANELTYGNGPTVWPFETLAPISNIDSPALSVYGINNLITDGWVFKYAPVGLSFSSATNSINTNYSNLPTNKQRKLLLTGGKGNVGTNVGNLSNFTLDMIDHVDTSSLESLRYCFIEVTGDNFDLQPANPFAGGEVNPIVFYNNYPSTYSIAARDFIINGNVVTLPLNQMGTFSVVNKREFFFNKRGLEMTLFSSATQLNNGLYSIGFKSIRLIETDMIPFFQFASDCIRRQTFVTWDTADINWEAAGMVGDPSAGPFANIDEIPGLGYPVWNNFYMNDDSNCLSYINENVVIPLIGHAPDIDYDSTNADYIASVTITNVF